MTNFSTELSGSLIFRSSSITTAVFRPSDQGLQLTGSLDVSGSDIFLRGVTNFFNSNNFLFCCSILLKSNL